MNNKILCEEDEFRGLDNELLKDEVAATTKPDKKITRVKKTPYQKALRVMLKRSGLSKPPLIERILEGKTGVKIPIREIGFLSNDKQKEPLLAELSKSCTVRNRLNRDEINKNRILTIGTEIFKAGHMWTPIHVHKDLSDGRYECVSGRHRLAFLAIVYGYDLEVPVYLEHLTLKAAREATAVANDGRPVKAIERASYAILRAVGGDSKADQKKIFNSLSNLRTNIIKYCVYSVMERGYPEKLTFKLSEKSSRPDGGITTVSNIEFFWDEGLKWFKGMSQDVFDAELKDSVRFLNAFLEEIQLLTGFDPDQHLTANVMSALGRYYQSYQNITSRNALSIVKDLARVIVDIGQTVNQSKNIIYNLIAGSIAGI